MSLRGEGTTTKQDFRTVIARNEAISIWAHISALRSRFFVRRASSQKELHSGRVAISS